MEDPIFSEDIDGWFKLAVFFLFLLLSLIIFYFFKNKFKDAKLKLGSKKLYSSLEIIDKVLIYKIFIKNNANFNKKY